MAMRCYVCNKKLNIFSDYTQIVVDGEKKEICTPCNRLREKKEVRQLLKTDEGKKEVSYRGEILITSGIGEICLGIFLMSFILSIFFLILVGFGVYSIYKGISYKHQSSNKEQSVEQDKEGGITFTSNDLMKIKKGHKILSRFYLILILIWIIIILAGIILFFH